MITESLIPTIAICLSLVSFVVSLYRATGFHSKRMNLNRMQVEKSADLLSAMHKLQGELLSIRRRPNLHEVRSAKSELGFPDHLLCDDETKWVIHKLHSSQNLKEFDDVWLRYRKLFPEKVRSKGEKLVSECNATTLLVIKAKHLAFMHKFSPMLDNAQEVNISLSKAKQEIFIDDRADRKEFAANLYRIVEDFENEIENLYFTSSFIKEIKTLCWKASNIVSKAWKWFRKNWSLRVASKFT